MQTTRGEAHICKTVLGGCWRDRSHCSSVGKAAHPCETVRVFGPWILLEGRAYGVSRVTPRYIRSSFRDSEICRRPAGTCQDLMHHLSAAMSSPPRRPSLLTSCFSFVRASLRFVLRFVLRFILRFVLRFVLRFPSCFASCFASLHASLVSSQWEKTHRESLDAIIVSYQWIGLPLTLQHCEPASPSIFSNTALLPALSAWCKTDIRDVIGG